MNHEKNFKWPRNPEGCLVPVQSILCAISVPVATTAGHMYKISDSEFDNIMKSYEALFNTIYIICYY